MIEQMWQEFRDNALKDYQEPEVVKLLEKCWLSGVMQTVSVLCHSTDAQKGQVLGVLFAETVERVSKWVVAQQAALGAHADKPREIQ